METSLDIQVNSPKGVSSTDCSVPVILLLGWAGCQDKHLQKYSKVYEDKGHITLRYCVPVSHMFWDRTGIEKSSKDIVKLLRDRKLNGHPVFVHVFSNGGAYLYEYVSRDLRKGGIGLKGVIFDSCPGDHRFKSLFRAMQEIFGKTPFIGPLLATLVFSILLSEYFMRLFYFKIKERLVGYYSQGSFPYEGLCNDDVTYPHLLFYSKKDHLIGYKDVEYFGDCREKVGNKVTKVCFDDSVHVKHLTQHPEVYKNSIYKFMEECLNGPFLNGNI